MDTVKRIRGMSDRELNEIVSEELGVTRDYCNSTEWAFCAAEETGVLQSPRRLIQQPNKDWKISHSSRETLSRDRSVSRAIAQAIALQIVGKQN